MGFAPTTLCVLDRMLLDLTSELLRTHWRARVIFVDWACEPHLAVMDGVTARCGSQVQPTKMTLARQRVLSSSEARASDLEHGGSWVRIPFLGLRFFLCPLMVDSLHLPMLLK